MATKFTVITTPIAPICRVYLDRPDDTPPEGATWKPNNKYKATQVLDMAQLAGIRKDFVKVLMATYPKADPDSAQFPWREGASEDKDGNEHPHKGKMLLTMQTGKEPECYDATGRNKLKVSQFPKFNDECRFKIALIPYDKEEEETVVDSKTGKRTKSRVKVYGVAARIYGVQLVRRNEGGGGFDAVEGGFEATDTEEDRADEDRGSSRKSSNRPDTEILDDDIPF